MAKRAEFCDTCYEHATYAITSEDEDGFSRRLYSCDECVDQYDEGWGDTIESLD